MGGGPRRLSCPDCGSVMANAGRKGQVIAHDCPKGHKHWSVDKQFVDPMAYQIAQNLHPRKIRKRRKRVELGGACGVPVHQTRLTATQFRALPGSELPPRRNYKESAKKEPKPVEAKDLPKEVQRRLEPQKSHTCDEPTPGRRIYTMR